MIASKGSTNGYRAWQLRTEWNGTSSKHNLVFSVDKTGCNCVAVAYSYADVDLAAYAGQWVHVATTWSSGSGTAAPKLYINGTEVGSYFTQGNDGGTNAIADTNSPTYIGSSQTPGEYFDGKIDEVRIWNVVRTPTELLNNYNVELNGTETGLVAYWRFNNNGLDASLYKNHITLINNPTYTTDVPFANTDSFALSAIQNISFEYDAVGNIVTLRDLSNTANAHVVNFTYDSLYRLTNASTTSATSTPYSETYVYDQLGNITSQTGFGTYMYQGTTTGNYANPHAPTKINGKTVSYDKNGNLTNYASTTNAWDYRNRLSWSYSSTSPSVFYTYDHTEQRMTKRSIGTATTTTPNIYYSTTGATSTLVKSIFANGELIATIKGSGTGVASTTKEYVHNDWLGGANLTTNASGTPVTALSYYPYGAERINTATTTTDRHYIGQRYDTETQNSYLNARYYNGDRGQFLSEDPVFWEIGQTRDGKAALLDPQSQNSYSYAQDNPIVKKDPDGRFGVKALVDLIENLSRLNDISRGTGSAADMVSAGMSGSDMSKGLGGVVLAGGSLLLPPMISVPLMLREGFMYLGEVSGADKPEVRDRVNKAIQNAQQMRSPIQTFTSGYQAPAIFNLFNGVSSGGTAPTFSGMPNFKGVYDFGNGNKYDYGKGQWVTSPPPATSGGSSSGGGNSSKNQTK